MADESASGIGMAAPATAAGLDEDALRARTWALLGRLLAQIPDESVLDVLGRIDAGDEPAGLMGAAWKMLRSAAERCSPAELDDEYHDLFIGVGRGEMVPYGSWYMTGFLMEQPLAQLRSELDLLGFVRQEGVAEPEDHAAALCDVMALISDGAGGAPLEVQARFFERHVAPWMGRFFRDMQQAPSARFYRAVGQLGEQFVELEKQYLNITGPPAKASAGRSGYGTT